MKPHIQKLPLSESTSFVARTYRTPHFEVGWHQHAEYELIVFTEGSGISFVGNHVGEFETGDIYFLAGNLPHTFQKRDPEMITSAVVVQFTFNFWGDTFVELPELKGIRELMETSRQGLKLHGNLKEEVGPLIRELEQAKGFNRILLLGNCLEKIAASNEWTGLSTQDIRPVQDKRIESVLQFTIDHFRDTITLSEVAALACMSVKSFCSYFKRSTRKTYIDFLNEVRIGYACSLLTDTHQPVADIGYASGYNTIAHFHKQFVKIKEVTPLQYRKAFAADNISKGKLIGIKEV